MPKQALLVPLILTLHGRVVAELGELRRDLHALAERVARIKGALTGPWRPTNGSPAPAAASKTPPEAIAASDLPLPINAATVYATHPAGCAAARPRGHSGERSAASCAQRQVPPRRAGR